MTQRTLFDDLREVFDDSAPYARGSDTSRAAAESVEPHLSRLERIVFEYIDKQGHEGATCWEVEKGCGLMHQTASARIKALKDAGRIRATNQKRTTNTGRLAGVYKATTPAPV